MVIGLDKCIVFPTHKNFQGRIENVAKVEDFCDLSNELRREAFNDPTVGSDLGSLRVDLLAVFGPPEPVWNLKK